MPTISPPLNSIPLPCLSVSRIACVASASLSLFSGFPKFRPCNRRKRMCGGAIISDFIPASRSKPLTADYLWPELKKNAGNYSKHPRPNVVCLDDDFEADFQDFKDHSDDEDEEYDVKPFATPPERAPPRGN
ncbi:hypothetical protein ACLOJK_000976 [Asimina triloba]